jgi:hypothetical protein
MISFTFTGILGLRVGDIHASSPCGNGNATAAGTLDGQADERLARTRAARRGAAQWGGFRAGAENSAPEA